MTTFLVYDIHDEANALIVKELEYIHSKFTKPNETLQINGDPVGGVNPCLTWGLPKSP